MAFDTIGSLFNEPDMLKFILNNLNKIIKNIPNISNYRYDFSNVTELENYLYTLNLNANHIKEAFKNANLEEGLYLFGEKETDLEIYNYSSKDIAVGNGNILEISCQVKSFPRPTFKLNFKGELQNLQVAYNRENDSYECVFRKEPAREADSGLYKLTINQARKNGDNKQNILEFFVQVGRDFTTKELHVSVTPTKVKVIPGEEVYLKAIINSDDPSQFTFKWFFEDKVNKQEKQVSIESSRQILKIVPTEEGSYRCLVEHISSRVNKFSEKVQVKLTKVSEYDLKILLIVGNADYIKIDCPLEECNKKFKPISSMDIYSNLSKIKAEMEALGFLAISFINLNAKEYLGSINLLKKLSDTAQKVLVLAYVAGHGHNHLSKDYLIPVDSHHYFHFGGHKGFLKESMNCSLHNLMKTFEDNEKFTVGVLWDLCRSFVKPNAELQINKDTYNYPYTILYSCNAGRQGYCLEQDFIDDGIELERGTIFCNLFLKNLNGFLELHQIGEKMNEDMKKLKSISKFHELDRIMCDSSPVKMKIKLKANISDENKKKIKQVYFNNCVKKIEHNSPDSIKKVIYWFEPDEFVNTILLKIETKHINIKTDISIKFDSRLEVKNIDRTMNREVYRIYNILRCDKDIDSFKLTIHDWFPNSMNPKERIVYVLELDFKEIWNHFQKLKKIIGWVEDISLDISTIEKFPLRQYDEENNLESDYSMSSTSLNSSGEHAGDEYYDDSSSITSTDEN